MVFSFYQCKFIIDRLLTETQYDKDKYFCNKYFGVKYFFITGIKFSAALVNVR